MAVIIYDVFCKVIVPSFLFLQCNEYNSGEITGSLCGPLCISQEIQYHYCFPNGSDKIFVALAKWGDKKIVLKTFKKGFKKTTLNLTRMTTEEFKNKVNLCTKL